MRKVHCGGKRRFRSHQEAVRSLHRIANRSTRDRQPVRTYECPKCKGWHLTSQAQGRG